MFKLDAFILNMNKSEVTLYFQFAIDDWSQINFTVLRQYNEILDAMNLIHYNEISLY